MTSNIISQKYYISVGEDVKMYTLRVHTTYRNPAHYSTHGYVKNLSNDPNTAIAKAKEYADNQGWPLVDVSITNSSLNEIHRRKSEDVQREREEQQERYERMRQERVEQLSYQVREMGLDEDQFPFGKYKGEYLTTVVQNNPGYIAFLINKAEDWYEHPRNLFELFMNRVQKKVADGEINIEQNKSKHIGEEGEKMDLQVTVKKIIHGTVNYGPHKGQTNDYKKVIMETEDGNVVVTKHYGKGFDEAEEGTKGVMMGTVAYHNEFNGVKQTGFTKAKFFAL